MQILNKNKSNFELRIESLDDLWILSQIISSNDKVFGTAERKVKVGAGENAKQVRKLFNVELLITKVVFTSKQLRISGNIQNETEFTSIGESHTLTYLCDEVIKFEKLSMLVFQKKLLEKAVSSKKSKNLLVLFDKDDFVAAEFSDFSFSVLFEESGLGSKKYSNDEINEEEQKLQLILDYLNKDYSNIIFAGPGLFKESLKKYVKDKLGINAITFAFGEVGANAVNKVIKEIGKSAILKDSQINLETGAINELLVNINKNSKFSYGYENSYESVMSSKCEKLLISTDLIDKKKEDKTYKELNELMMTCEKLNSELVIVNSKNEPGKILDGLGSIATINRY